MFGYNCFVDTGYSNNYFVPKIMKLLTHNFLSSRFLKGAKEGYPLLLTVVEKKEVPCDYDSQMMISILERIDYNALRVAVEAVGLGSHIPAEKPDINNASEEVLQSLHKILYGVEIVDGKLTCPDTGREFPIKDGIPNMLCEEGESI